MVWHAGYNSAKFRPHFERNIEVDPSEGHVEPACTRMATCRSRGWLFFLKPGAQTSEHAEYVKGKEAECTMFTCRAERDLE